MSDTKKLRIMEGWSLIILVALFLLYVTSYVLISRISYRIEVNTPPEMACHFYLPVHSSIIATTPWMKSLHYMLAAIYFPLSCIDQFLTGIWPGSLPLTNADLIPDQRIFDEESETPKPEEK